MSDTRSLKGKTLFITGASRGIGHAIARRAAAHGANIVIAAKTAQPHHRLPRTLYSAPEEIRAAGGQALPVQVDIRDEEAVLAAVRQAVMTFGGKKTKPVEDDAAGGDDERVMQGAHPGFAFGAGFSVQLLLGLTHLEWRGGRGDGFAEVDGDRIRNPPR